MVFKRQGSVLGSWYVNDADQKPQQVGQEHHLKGWLKLFSFHVQNCTLTSSWSKQKLKFTFLHFLFQCLTYSLKITHITEIFLVIGLARSRTSHLLP